MRETKINEGITDAVARATALAIKTLFVLLVTQNGTGLLWNFHALQQPKAVILKLDTLTSTVI